MLAVILNNVYIGDAWVARECICRCKSRAWKHENTTEALKYRNLERVLDAKVMKNQSQRISQWMVFSKKVSMTKLIRGCDGVKLSSLTTCAVFIQVKTSHLCRCFVSLNLRALCQ